jgi:tagatose-1,6-bisphosphate aldolase
MNLSSIQTPEGLFTIAPFDHRNSLAEMFNMDIADSKTGEFLTQLKTLFMEAFSPMCSGVLVDPVYGFPAITHKAKNTGLILTLEGIGYTKDKAAIPTMIPDWGVENVKNNYAVAKLLIYYHPGEANAEAKKKLVMELCEYCHQQDISFLLEPIIFNPNGKEELSTEDFQEAQLVMMQEFQPHCDVIKIQYPGNALAAATITAELDIPWILLSRGMDFGQFKEALKVSMENGAKGFAAGRSVWQEIAKIRDDKKKPDLVKIEEFLQTTGKQRVQELIDITQKFA